MPSRPGATPSWATDANYPAGTDPWSATPTRVEPDAAQKGTGNVPATRPPAQHHNWLQGLIADWIGYFAAIIDANEEHTYQTPKARQTTISPLRAPHLPMVGSTPPTEDAPWFGPMGGTEIRSKVDDAFMLIPLDWLPDGAVITAVHAIVLPGAARAAVADRMWLDVQRQTTTWGTATVGGLTTLGNETNGEQVDDGTANAQVMTIDQFTETVTINKAGGVVHYIFVKSGDDAGAHNADAVRSLRVDWNDPGPRNA
jgi:hypothetical protein